MRRIIFLGIISQLCVLHIQGGTIKSLFGIGIGYQKVVSYQPVLMIHKPNHKGGSKKIPLGFHHLGGGGGGYKPYVGGGGSGYRGGGYSEDVEYDPGSYTVDQGASHRDHHNEMMNHEIEHTDQVGHTHIQNPKIYKPPMKVYYENNLSHYNPRYYISKGGLLSNNRIPHQQHHQQITHSMQFPIKVPDMTEEQNEQTLHDFYRVINEEERYPVNTDQNNNNLGSQESYYSPSQPQGGYKVDEELDTYSSDSTVHGKQVSADSWYPASISDILKGLGSKVSKKFMKIKDSIY